MTAPRSQRRAHLVLGGALLLVTLNMRAGVVVVSPVLQSIRGDTGLSALGAGLLVSVPVLCFGAFALVGSRMTRRIGAEETLLVAVLLVAAGTLLRLWPPVAALFAGTLVLGVAVGLSNVVVPVVIKQHFPERVGLMTGLYVTGMLGAATIALAVTVPIMTALSIGWRPALAAWAVPALLSAAAWALVVPRRSRGSADPSVPGAPGLWRDPLAWQVSLFMGCQSLIFYATSAWAPTVLADGGLSSASGGLLLAVANGLGIPASLLTATLAGRLRTQYPLVVATVALTGAGLLGLLVAPTTAAPVWMVLFGLGQGGSLGIALTIIGLRASDSRDAAPLSGMAQTVGYLLAAIGPLLVGALHDLSGGWTLPFGLLTAALLPQLVVGIGASRPRHVGERQPTAPGPDTVRATAGG